MLALNLAEVEFRDGNASQSLKLLSQGLTTLRAIGNTDSVLIAFLSCSVAAYLVALRRFDEAIAASHEAVAAASDCQLYVDLLWALQHLSAVAALRPCVVSPPPEGRRRAARILGYVDARLAALECTREYTDQHEYDAILPALRESLGEGELSRLMSLGGDWTEDQAIAEAMLI